MHTGENGQGLRKILDLTRMISIVLLLIHFYYYCYGAFRHWGMTLSLTDRLLQHISYTGLFASVQKSKAIVLVMLAISLLGAKGRKSESLHHKTAFAYLLIGLALYFCSYVLFRLEASRQIIALAYMTVTVTGFIGVLTGGTLLSRIIQLNLSSGVFNTLNETFPQEERLLENEYSVNLPARYNLKGRIRSSWINIINPFRGLLVMGSPGSGKSYFIIQHIIRQHIQKGFSMFLYDFKYDDLSKIAYNHYLCNKNRYAVPPSFYVINFDDLHRSHRCNPLDSSTLLDITDAAESSRTIMLGLNHEWIKKSGDFFVESPINFVTALIWFLRKYKNGKYCTLPHVIELAQVSYDKLFSVLRTEPQIEVLINPFLSAYLNDANEQLEGQIASAKISLSRLSTDRVYYILSGNDFTLDINNPQAPKVVCIGNNPQKTQTYGAVLSLFTTTLSRLINRKGGCKSSLILDEFPTLYFHGIDHLIATARSNKVATILAIQDGSQLRVQYGKEQADVIFNIIGNVISGQVTGDTAKQLSERFGKILQDRESVSINRTDTSVSRSKQLELAIPPSKIASLSAGTFVGMVADNPEQPIALKSFCAQIVQHHTVLAREQAGYKELPVVAHVSTKEIEENFLQIKKEVADLVQAELERILNTPALSDWIIKK